MIGSLRGAFTGETGTEESPIWFSKCAEGVTVVPSFHARWNRRGSDRGEADCAID